MNSLTHEAIATSLPKRLAAAVEKKLGCPVEFVRWVRDPKTGADTPVFSVPAHAHTRALESGLTIEWKL